MNNFNSVEGIHIIFNGIEKFFSYHKFVHITFFKGECAHKLDESQLMS